MAKQNIHGESPFPISTPLAKKSIPQSVLPSLRRLFLPVSSMAMAMNSHIGGRRQVRIASIHAGPSLSKALFRSASIMSLSLRRSAEWPAGKALPSTWPVSSQCCAFS